MIAARLFPSLAPVFSNGPQVLIADQALLFQVGRLPNPGPPPRRDRRDHFPFPQGVIHAAFVIGPIRRDLCDRFFNLVEQPRQFFVISHAVVGDRHRQNVAGRFIDADVQLFPRAALGIPMLAHLPLSFAKHFDPGAVHDQMHVGTRLPLRQLKVQGLLPTRQRAVTRHGYADFQQLKHRSQQALRRPLGQMIDGPHRGHTFNRHIGVGLRVAPLAAGWHLRPSRQHLRADPHAQAPALDQRFVILAPVADTVSWFLFGHTLRITDFSVRNYSFVQQSHLESRLAGLSFPFIIQGLMPGELILLVDDEPNIIELARLYLERDGFRTVAVSDGQSALDSVAENLPALMVLDLMLPQVEGYEVCRRVRATSDVPIIMLTARDDDIDKIIGLELGADDYMTKPFNPRELVARVKAILRRSERAAKPESTNPMHLADVTIDPARREVTVSGKTVNLRTKEFDLLLTLAEHRGLVLTREQLLDLVWGFDYVGQTRTIDVHVAHLRKVLAGSHVSIETITGVGYKLVTD
jgi:two-component system, OmpR family, alkaline phosphatase synthesis response regulator PhoP